MLTAALITETKQTQNKSKTNLKQNKFFFVFCFGFVSALRTCETKC